MMRKETPEVLAILVTKFPKRTLLGLWSDLKKLSKAEFEALLSSSAKRPARTSKGTPARQKIAMVPDDTPSSRIEHLLLVQAAMDQSQAVDEITAQLVRQSISASRIPSSHGQQFADWLSALFRSVPAAQVMHAAIQISARLPRSR